MLLSTGRTTMSVSDGEDDPCSSSSVHDVGDTMITGSPEVVEMCRVCGRKSAGKHYSVPACHGCKSFFRRATLNKTIYPDCKYNHQCFSDTSVNIRPRKCRFCRLEKCYKAGMVAIVSSHRKPPENRENSGSISDAELPELTLSPPLKTRENIVSGIIEKLHHLDIQTDKFRKSAFNPFTVSNLDGLLTSPGKLDLADKYGPMQGWPITHENFVDQQVLMNTIKCDDTSTTMSTCGINTKDWLSFDMLTAVEYAKTFPFMQQLNFTDKILLTKATTFMNLSLTSAYSSFLSNMAILQMPDGVCISGPVGKSEREVRSFERRLSHRVMAPLIRNVFDKTEYVLLKAIILCNSAVTDLSFHAQQVVLHERYKFTGALLFYCMNRYGTSGGPARYYAILNMVDVLEHHQKDFRDFMLLLDMAVPTRYADDRRMLQREILDF